MIVKWMLLMLGWFGLSMALLTHRLLPLAVGYAFTAGVTATALMTYTPMLELVAPVGALTLVAQAIYFLCTEASSYVNGAEIHINGGQHV